VPQPPHRSLRDTGDHDARVAVSDQDRIEELLRLDHIDDVGDVGVERNGLRRAGAPARRRR
jgi:hypothetical protein